MTHKHVPARLRWTGGLVVLLGTLGLAVPIGAQTDAAAPVSEDDLDEAPELTERTQTAIDRGLEYLAATQNPNGSWSREDQYAVADTALGLMAFMVKAHFPGEGPYGDKLTKALDFLLTESKASADGYLGTSMYAHGLATLALSEVWGMSDTDKDDDVLEALRKAVMVIRRSQNLLGGWRYDPTPEDADLSVTVTQVVALASARQAGVVVPDVTIDKAIEYATSCWHQESGGFKYQPHHGGPQFPRSAGATYALQLCGRRDAEQVKAGMRYLNELRDQNRVFFEGNHFFYGHYYGIQAMVQAGDQHYEAWYPRIRDALLGKQAPDGSWSGGRGGRPQSTAMALIVLGTPYRYIPIYQR
ncbi:MAG: terpene cyclase/mutase family protein [Phycisphaerae bacterium]|nr:terpene cyclase/mutase family protein [Phycisphaerae bacterium]